MIGDPRPEQETPVTPVRIKLPKDRNLVTIILIVITVLVFILQYLLESITGVDFLFVYGGKFYPFIKRGELWRLITPIFLHGSITHILFNMYALFVIGRRMERFYGHKRFLLLYLLSGFAGNTLSFVLTPAPSLGASTAIFGLLASEGMFIVQNRKLFGPVRTRQAVSNFLIILVINLVYGFMPGTNIDIMGHIGGFIGGLFFAWKAGPILKIGGQPPFFDMVDARKKSDVFIASLVVLIGFALIAAIPFISG